MHRTIAVAILLVLPSLARAALDANGWTIINPAADTRTIYVSSSAGSDLNSGLSPDAPLATIGYAKTLLRDFAPDHLLLKRGDVFNESFGTWIKRGRSADEPLVLGAYGTGPRPLLKTGTSNGMTVWSASLGSYSNIAIVGLHFQASGNTGAANGSAGLRWDRPGSNLLIEDAVFERYASNLVIQSVDLDNPLRNLTIRRSQLLDAFANHAPLPGASHAQGLYTHNVKGALIEENLFDHNGWNEEIVGAEPTIFNHNIYIQTTSADVVVRGNIIARGASHGLQLRPGGVADGNLFVDNSLGFFLGGLGTAIDNVVLHGSAKPMYSDGYPRTWGVEMKDVAGSSAIRNLIAHAPGGVNALIGLDGVYTEDNVIYKWGPESTPSALEHPVATIGDYDRFLGGDGTLEHFLAMARMQSRDGWDPSYTADRAVPYFWQSAWAVPEPGGASVVVLIARALLRRRTSRGAPRHSSIAMSSRITSRSLPVIA
jgi:hypothetical protein